MIINRIRNIKFTVTTTDNRQINLIYKGRATCKRRISRQVINTLEQDHGIHPGRVQELLIGSS